MGLKKYRPITASLRTTVTVDYSLLTPRKKKPKTPKSLLAPYRKKGARNHFGRMTVRHHGGGHKRKYRVIDFARDKIGVPGVVKSIEYDPNRNTFIALIYYQDGEKRYILAPHQLKEGARVLSSDEADIVPGNALRLKAIPVGTLVHNVELHPNRGGALVRSAGAYAQVMGKEASYVILRLPSGEMRKVHIQCRATVGQLSNLDHENISLGKAGRARWLGRRPHVRGVVMNPVDHPMGGGEGRASGGHPRSPWGQSAKGLKTRRNKRTGRFIVKRRK